MEYSLLSYPSIKSTNEAQNAVLSKQLSRFWDTALESNNSQPEAEASANINLTGAQHIRSPLTESFIPPNKRIKRFVIMKNEYKTSKNKQHFNYI